MFSSPGLLAAIGLLNCVLLGLSLRPHETVESKPELSNGFGIAIPARTRRCTLLAIPSGLEDDVESKPTAGFYLSGHCVGPNRRFDSKSDDNRVRYACL